MSIRIVPLRQLMNYQISRNLGATSNIIKFQNVRKMSDLRPFNHVKSIGFSWAGMKKHNAVLPLVFLIGGTMLGLIGFIIYASQTRDNVVFKRSTQTLSQSMDLLNPRPLKMRVMNQEYKPMVELDTLLKEIRQSPVKEQKQEVAKVQEVEATKEKVASE